MNKKKIFLFLLLAIIIIPLAAAAADQGIGTIATAIKNAAWALGVPLVIVGWVTAGILYLTSAGNPQRAATAKQALIAAITGTVLIILATNACTFVQGILGNIGTCT